MKQFNLIFLFFFFFVIDNFVTQIYLSKLHSLHIRERNKKNHILGKRDKFNMVSRNDIEWSEIQYIMALRNVLILSEYYYIFQH